MRLKFWKKEPGYDDIEFVKPKRPRETLFQTAERIIQRKMLADPDGYLTKQFLT